MIYLLEGHLVSINAIDQIYMILVRTPVRMIYSIKDKLQLTLSMFKNFR